MKNISKLALLIGLVASTHTFADTIVRYGHWPVASIQFGGQNYGHVLINQNDFSVLSWETIGLLECAKDTYPKSEIVIDGQDGPALGNGGGVITQAVICTGEIGLGNCLSGEKTSCP